MDLLLNIDEYFNSGINFTKTKEKNKREKAQNNL